MVIDCFIYNGEKDLLKLRLHMLDSHVDRFIICEAKTTFSGKKKSLYFPRHEYLVKKFWKKISFHITDESYSKEELELARSSPNTGGLPHWEREFLQKEAMKKAISHYATGEDTVYISDVDEIWDVFYRPYKPLERLKLRVYAYYLDNRSDEPFWGVLTGKWKYMKDQSLNHLDSDPRLCSSEYGGWHFTSMGGLDELTRKIESYGHQEFNTSEIKANLPNVLENGGDFIGRPFNFKLDESDWPQYLKSNRSVYEHLCKVKESGGIAAP